jgi:penicillin-binding protein 2
MMSMVPIRFRVVFFALLVALIASAAPVTGQSRSKAAKKPTAAADKKGQVKTKDAKKDKRKEKDLASKKERDKKDQKKELAKANDRNKKAKDRKSEDRAEAKKSKKDDKPSKADRAEKRREDAERKRREEERRQAILAEIRRREQARREAIARKLAFERGLRTETVANIAADRTDGEDLAIRNVAINALGSHAGSVVVMEAQTGKVLTVVNQNWAVRSSIRPCSTIKLVTGAAGVYEDVIDRRTGAVKKVATRRNLDDALAYSDNPYFQRAGVAMGNMKLVETARDLGLGEPTGINLDGETAGRLPLNNQNPRIYSHGDDTEVSTIQLAVMVSAITNGGKKVLPRIPRTSIEKARFQTFYKDVVDMPQKHVRRVIPGMIGASEYGTARRGVNHSLGIAGKTGSCIDKGSWVGLFTSVAPIEQPKYAVAVITRGQRERGRHAAAIAGKIYQALAPQLIRTNTNLALTEFGIQPRHSTVAARPPATDVEGEDEIEDADIAGSEQAPVRNVIVVPSAPRQVEAKKYVQKTTSSQPTNFPPVVITYSRDGSDGAPREKKRERIAKP